MITQNLFSTQPKTFMDYEPGKIPTKNEWNTQTTKTKTYDPFASNVKLVGDDMTEKDYDTFFEGFRSVNENPLWQEPETQKLTRSSFIGEVPKTQTFQKTPSFGGNEAKWQTSLHHPSTINETKIEFLPHRPPTDGEAKFQPFPYIPAKNEQSGFINYSEKAPWYVQAKNNLQKSMETFWGEVWDEIKEPFVDRKNLLDELVRICGDLSPEATSAMKTILNPLADSNSQETASKVLEDEIMRIHYGRNQYNVDLPANQEQAEAWGWGQELANCHQNTVESGGKANIKYVSPDGKREVIFDHTGTRVITADEDAATYNYADPDLWLAHAILDILPWIEYGNTPEDTTDKYQRIGGSLFGK